MKKQLIQDAIKESLDNVARLELFNAYLYNVAAAVAKSAGLFGIALKFSRESDDEVQHHRDVVEYLNQRGCLFVPGEITAPVLTDETIKGLITAAYNQEVLTEKAYIELGSLALNTGVHATYQFVHEVLEHQTASVGEYADLIARIEQAATNEAALLLIDQEIGKV
jgi:ferritin